LPVPVSVQYPVLYVCLFAYRREVELMYDNAMQAMIKKKEEEFAQLQV
jgi:hypothetical protein